MKEVTAQLIAWVNGKISFVGSRTHFYARKPTPAADTISRGESN
jgi:hypothetical protein